MSQFNTGNAIALARLNDLEDDLKLTGTRKSQAPWVCSD